jgi:cysteine synthase A
MNPDNIAAHRETTGKEIIEQTDGKVDAFIGAIGTGGTLLGVAEALKRVNPKVKIFGVEPVTSSLFQMAPEIKVYMEKYRIPGVEGWIIEEIQKRKIVDEIFWSQIKRPSIWPIAFVRRKACFVECLEEQMSSFLLRLPKG